MAKIAKKTHWVDFFLFYFHQNELTRGRLDFAHLHHFEWNIVVVHLKEIVKYIVQ